LLGFGISLNALFNEYSDFSNYSNLLLSMFQMSLNVFEYDTFQVSDEYRHVGQAIMVIMALSVSIILVNAIIAKFGVKIYILINILIFNFFITEDYFS